MEPSGYIAACALIISIAGFLLSLYGTVLDRSKIKVEAIFYTAEYTYGQPHIVVKATNHGRRAAIISRFGGDLEVGGWEAVQLGDKSGGVRLGEGEFTERPIVREDLYVQFPDGESSSYWNFWFEDSVGKRYIVPRSECLILELKKAYGDVV
ncbi:hypothetical protein [Salinisphaera sp. T5B8]|uniref:hypothetical protein n=1 Tax=Salinisphaera sp. T5B8 TaxID=1304154 RepID=UPI0033428FA1